MHQKQIKGVSVLELLLVFLIASALILVAASRYMHLKRNSYVEALKYNIDSVKQASVLYYRSHIDDPSALSVSNLKAEGFWPSSLHRGIVASDDKYGFNVGSISLDKGEKTYYFELIVAFPNSEVGNLDWFKRMLNATTVNSENKTIIFHYLPAYYEIPSTKTGLWIMNADLQRFKRLATDK